MIIVLSLLYTSFSVVLTSRLTTQQGLAFLTVSAPTREEVEKLSSRSIDIEHGSELVMISFTTVRVMVS